ncbi:hypothetical protein [Amycolatopsis sp. NPDC051071]|uniref:hypothetical protein n=1 Tax=Amycolatopsis sp. NPDC051071 TaxID=3154637 RepID=UPI00343FCDDB
MVLLLSLSDDEHEYLGRAPQPGLTLDLLALVFTIVVAGVVWFIPVRRRTAVG